jgi:metal-responsive CopG/Arc/MetJ family transcriptional regulator
LFPNKTCNTRALWLYQIILIVCENHAKNLVNVKLPTELAKEIDEILKERTFGYRSRGEFVTEATRTLLIKLKTLTKEKSV